MTQVSLLSHLSETKFVSIEDSRMFLIDSDQSPPSKNEIESDLRPTAISHSVEQVYTVGQDGIVALFTVDGELARVSGG